MSFCITFDPGDNQKFWFYGDDGWTKIKYFAKEFLTEIEAKKFIFVNKLIDGEDSSLEDNYLSIDYFEKNKLEEVIKIDLNSYSW